MSKKSISIIFILIILSSCMRWDNYPPPIGIWQSKTPYITLYIQLKLENSHWLNEIFEGTLITDEGEEIIVHLRFHGVTPGLWIFIAPDDPETPIFSQKNELFSGSFEVIGDRLYYSLNTESREEAGIDVIVFDRIEVSNR